MKPIIVTLFLLLSLSTIGCGSLPFRLANETEVSAYSTAYAVYPTQSPSSTGIEVYQKAPFALQVGIEDAQPEPNANKINGDGGASLNAYAACLTLKVIF
jgi:hypothetical protein